MRKNLLFIIAITLSTSAFGHGYIMKSRAKLCAQGVNHNCGPVIWEPQSVEGPDRFPSTGPADGTIAGAGSPRWVKLNEQSPTRWHKVDIQSGQNTFKWHFTATHRTRDFRYFITKQNWDTTQPLTRQSFDLKPFCSVSGNGQRPATDISHTCHIPNRSGYQIILGVWDVGDTSSSFYSVIDANMSGDSTPSPLPPTTGQKDVGDINPSADLTTNDVVRVRLFSHDGELQDQALEMTIASEAQGKKNTWPKLLAEYINAQNTDLEAGIKNRQGNIVPVFGKNDVFAEATSTITRIEIEIDLAEVDASLDIKLHQSAFTTGKPMHLVLDATADPAMKITAEFFYQGAKIGYQETSVVSTTQLQLVVDKPQAGAYQLIVKGETADQQQTVQKNFTVSVIDSTPVDPTPVDPAGTAFPANIGSYTVGTVIRGQDGNIYQCLVAGWCNGSRAYYAPGLGLAWEQAWIFIASGVAPAVQADFTYPKGRGNYQQGTIVNGADNALYRCKIPGWCNHPSSFYYEPGTGLAWDSAWTAL
jgi:chitin-binding protein